MIDGLFHGKSHSNDLKWMIGGSPTLGNLHVAMNQNPGTRGTLKLLVNRC